MRPLLAVTLLALASTAGAREPDEVTPLFRDEAPLAITLSGPLRRIAVNAPRSTEAAPGTLTTGSEQLAITLAARGVSRRERNYCRFPPLRVSLATKPDHGSLFQGQRRLKLVTHCNPLARFEQHLLREYAAYRLYNLLTPESFRVRLLRVSYEDAGKPLGTKWGFFIEDADDAAARLGMRELQTATMERTAYNQQAAARFALFQYMIGNTDWDITAGPPGNDCCHNVKLAAPDRQLRANIIPLPYDFDNSGLVEAPYAAPSEALPIRFVTDRYYRGYCAFKPQVLQEADSFRNARPAMEALLGSIPGLADPTRRTMRRYLDQFFADIETPASIERKLFARCR